jgi:hypothetical protein
MTRRAGIAAGLGAVVLAIALGGTAGAGVNPPTKGLGKSHGLRYLAGTHGGYETGTTFVYLTCSADFDGRFPLGGGADVTGPPKRSRLTTNFQAKGAWIMEGWNLAPATRKVRVFAICPRQVPDASLVYDEIPIDAGESDPLVVTCPGGSFPTGGGPQIEDGLILQSAPYDSISDPNKRPDGWRVLASTPEASGHVLDVGVTCLDVPRRDIKYVTESRRVKGNGVKTVRARCPGSTAAMSGGFKVGGAGSFLHSLVPFDSKGDRKKVPDDGFAATVVNGASTKKNAAATAVCLR